MTEPVWLKGTLTGTCVGKPTRKRGGSGLARWYQLRLVEAVVAEWTPVAGPPKAAPGGQAPFSQPKLRDARLRASTPGGTDELLSLRELSVWDWKVQDGREGGGESRCTLRGTVYAKVVEGTRRPAPPEGADRLDRWGILAVLLGLLAGFWLWWTCGPFTCALWSAVVLGSWLSHLMRTRRRSPPTLLSKVLQGALALGLLVGGAALVLGMADPGRADACGGEPRLAVLVGAAAVVGVSLLTVSWPRIWMWIVWTAVVALWCGHSGTDCAWLWIRGASAKGATVAVERRLQRLRERLVGPLGARGDDRADVGSGGGSGTGDAVGRASGTGVSDGGGAGGPGGSGAGDGAEFGATGGTGPGAGAGAPGGSEGEGRSGNGAETGAVGGMAGGSASGGETGEGSGAGSGEGEGGAGGGGSGTGSGAGTGEGSSSGASAGPGGGGAADEGDGESLDAAYERRMSVEAALSDPKQFLDGTARVTLAGDLLFAFDEDQLRPQAEPKLREVARLLAPAPELRVLLEGHADTIGGDDYNLDLSERRARAVKAWLVGQAQIDPSRIDTIGYGSAKPLVPASRGPAAQEANRRVEVRVLAP